MVVGETIFPWLSEKTTKREIVLNDRLNASNMLREELCCTALVEGLLKPLNETLIWTI